MPTTVRWPVRVSRGVSVYDRFLKEKKGALGLHFEMEKGDTVYAMRRGTVVEVGIPEREPDAPAVSFTSESPDLLVEVGDEVLPGTPLALAGSYDGERYKVSVQTFWWESNPDPKERERKPFIRKHFFPQFVTEEGVVCVEKGVYRPVETEELVIREMNRKELKKHRGGKKR